MPALTAVKIDNHTDVHMPRRHRVRVGVLAISVSLGALLAPVAAATAAYHFKVTPDPHNAPGATGLQHAVNGFAVYALIACAAGFLIGAAAWAVGGRIGNDVASSGGKSGLFVALGAAFILGAADGILNLAYKLGSGG